ncbi:uroporphyrinogen-III synthase [Gilvimarinus xylanilyticus]|uniref:Uroporphyrinogen-III synthase n=1 Tax=Gilvimarinus xylanilyticus TaxID=2944139 RepID=A0A9X2I692_9GAMM|nr:uroporphyrinogen-III synthase [Gilvimarinus xylanilyticus]MCP8899627.1 uroporphyrinogen-III synthase [Gilvimarinus xylanilyticus]
MTAARILVTRPQPLADEWQSWLQRQGYDAQAIPVMALEALDDFDSEQRIKSVVMNLDEYQKAIFVSRNAVHYAAQWLEDYWPQWPIGLQCLAVGRATADALDPLDLPVAALGDERSAMNSEHLLASRALGNVSGEKIVIFRGQGGRELMTRTLTERGARVEHCELYRRVLPAQSAPRVKQWLEAGQSTDLITVHSGESLTNLLDLARRTETQSLLRERTFLVPGDRVAQLAREAGLARLWVARNAGSDAMLEQIQAYAGTLD